jgi:NADH:ubiquinone oxidoreductase subunit K
LLASIINFLLLLTFNFSLLLGLVFALVIIILAAAESAIRLGFVISIYQVFRNISTIFFYHSRG